MKMELQSLIKDTTRVLHVLNVDSKGLLDTITAIQEGFEYRLRQMVQQIRNFFEAEDLEKLRESQCIDNIADALRKKPICTVSLTASHLRAR